MVPDAVGGVADHVHLLIGLKPVHRIADVVRELKKSSTTWIREHFDFNADFRWQEGYGAFSVSPSARESVRQCIARQAEHHQRRGFLEGLVELLDQAGVTYDPRHLD